MNRASSEEGVLIMRVWTPSLFVHTTLYPQSLSFIEVRLVSGNQLDKETLRTGVAVVTSGYLAESVLAGITH